MSSIAQVIDLIEKGCDRAEIVRDLKRLQEFNEAIGAGDAGLMAEQASLLRQCKTALDDLLAARPILRAFHFGGQSGTTLGNLRAEFHEPMPHGIMRQEPDHG
jgi:hypothetical protein